MALSTGDPSSASGMPLSMWASASPRVLQLVQARQQIVAGGVGDFGLQSQLAVDVLGGVCETAGVEAAGVDDDLDALLGARLRDLAQLTQEGAGIAQILFAGLVLEQDHHGQLGEVVAGEEVDRAVLNHLFCGSDAVAVKAAAVRDTE